MTLDPLLLQAPKPPQPEAATSRITFVVLSAVEIKVAAAASIINDCGSNNHLPVCPLGADVSTTKPVAN